MTDVGTDERRKPGRPRRFGPGRISATVRFTPERYRDLKAEAVISGRSISEEVETRIEKLAVLVGASLAGAGAFSADASVVHGAVLASENTAIGQELLAKAMARIAELEKAQTLNEEMIERAVLRALTKTRLTIGT